MITDVMFSLIRFEVAGKPLTKEEREAITKEVLPSLYKLSKMHDMAHLVGDALAKLGLLDVTTEVGAKFQKQAMLAVFRCEQLRSTLKLASEALEDACIPHIPLKGSVLRNYYPQPWMRTSCDIDILIHEEDIDKATKILTNMGATQVNECSHDISFDLRGVHLELHHMLMEDTNALKSAKILQNVWNYTELLNSKKYTYALSETMFYFYHLAHAVKHFRTGGCGVKPFVDLWILNNKFEQLLIKSKPLLQQTDLLSFAIAANELTDMWMKGEEKSEDIKLLAEYILNGGVYGTIQNSVVAQSKGNKFKYVINRIFLPYDSMKYAFPILNKHKWLLPFCWVARWFKRLFDGGLKHASAEVSAMNKIDEQSSQKTAQLMNYLGLQ